MFVYLVALAMAATTSAESGDSTRRKHGKSQ